MGLREWWERLTGGDADRVEREEDAIRNRQEGEAPAALEDYEASRTTSRRVSTSFQAPKQLPTTRQRARRNSERGGNHGWSQGLVGQADGQGRQRGRERGGPLGAVGRGGERLHGHEGRPVRRAARPRDHAHGPGRR